MLKSTVLGLNAANPEVHQAPSPVHPPSSHREDEILYDEQGPIPNFPIRRAFDEHGRLIPMSPEEREARADAYRRKIKVINEMDRDSPDTFEEFKRAMDSHRPEGMKLFEGNY